MKSKFIGSPELYFDIDRLFADYCACLDEGDLNVWPQLFLEHGRYLMIARENYEHGYEIPLVLCENRAMMEDRVFSLEHANIYQAHRYRHAMSGIRVHELSDAVYTVSSSFMVVQTLQDSDPFIYQCGSYRDQLCYVDNELMFKERVVIYDAARVQTLLATPV